MLIVGVSMPRQDAPIWRNRKGHRLGGTRSIEAFLVQDRLCASDVIHRDMVGRRWR
jgi:hypothetical protein